MDIRERSVEEVGLSKRASNCLMRGKIRTVGAMLEADADTLYRIPYMGKQSVEEVLQKIEEYRTFLQDGANPKQSGGETFDLSAWAESEEGKAAIRYYYDRQERTIDELTLLSARSFNTLTMCGYTQLSQILFLSEEELLQLPGIGPDSVREISMVCAEYRREHASDIDDASAVFKAQTLSMEDLLRTSEYRDTIVRYAKHNDRDLNGMNLSYRALTRLHAQGYRNLSDILFLTEKELKAIPGMGSNSSGEILFKVQEYLAENSVRIRNVCGGDDAALVTDEAIRSDVLRLYQTIGFNGLHFPEIKDALHLPPSVTDQRLKQIIGTLLADGLLEYVDFCCYRVYPGFADYLDRCDAIDDRSKEFLRRRLGGLTLEDISIEFNLTRQRVQQIVKKSVEKVRDRYAGETGLTLFDEDYYRYLFETYSFDKKDALKWLGIPAGVFRYFDLIDIKQGKSDLESAPDDKQIETGLRLKIRNYLNRNKIRIDGRWIGKERAELEPTVLEKYGQNDITFDEFCKCYNRFLEEREIPFDEKLYYTDSVRMTRKNRLADSRFALWKQNETLRYYDIDGHEYTELFDGLGLSEYENIGISTEKWLREFPELMQKYDIRDRYDLHNLLRKVIPNGSFHEIFFERTPHIRFGTFDRDAAMWEILRDNAPVSADDLAALVEDEYGFDPALTKSTYLKPFAAYYHQGIYRIDQPEMDETRREALQKALPEDFYFTDEVRTIYRRLFPDADEAEINPYNLKKMGFQVLSRYVLQRYDTAESYFRSLLTRDELIDIEPYRKRYGYIPTFSSTLMALKRSLTVIEYEPNRILSLSKLERAGIAKDDLISFCDAVAAFAPDKSYFSIQSLKQDGFTSDLFDLGFSDWFYANLLLSDERITFGTMFGTLLFRKDGKEPTARDLLEESIAAHESIAVYDLMNELADRHDCRIGDRWDVLNKLYQSPVFHDGYSDRLYITQSAYEHELAESEVLFQ